MNEKDVKESLEKNPKIRSKLYSRGFLFTNKNVSMEGYPFYSNWKKYDLKDAYIFFSPEWKGKNYFSYETQFYRMIIIGHAYDPFAMQKDENQILKDLCTALSNSDSLFYEKLNQLTGVFTIIYQVKMDKEWYVIGDPSGMQNVFYAGNNSEFYVSSHTNLIADVSGADWSTYAEKLVTYKFFKLFGNMMPGNITQFSNVYRMIPNHFLKISMMEENLFIECIRFYTPHVLDMPFPKIVEEVSEILNHSMELISLKWDRPAISLTGGCDSKTTLACATGLYDRFQYFSYVSSEEEKVDAEAAAEICKAINLEHKIYYIPDKDEECPDIEDVRRILWWNGGGIRINNPNDVRKRILFDIVKDFDVEVKSWASEIGRAYYSKRFHGRRNFGKSPDPRACTTLYKVFLHNRKLVRETDRVFEEYIAKYFQQDTENPLPWQEQFFWEFRVAAWNGLVITGEHRYSFDITIPYNNRKLFELLLSVPLEDRISDRLYKDVRHKMNPYIDETGIAVTNVKHTNRREIIENFYYALHSKIPF